MKLSLISKFTNDSIYHKIYVFNIDELLRFEATYVVRFGMSRQKELTRNMTSECWSPVACWLFLTEYKHLTNIIYSQALSML